MAATKLAATKLAALPFVLLGGLVGCGTSPAAVGKTDGASSADAFPLPFVLFVGAATDDALLRLLDAAPRDAQSRRLVIQTSPAGAPLRGTDRPATFTFTEAQAAAPPAPGATRAVRAPVWRRVVGRLAEVAALWAPERAAQAHGVPFNGTGYFLVVSDASSRQLLRVFTDETSYTPDAARWGYLANGQQPLTLSITWAQFEENDIPVNSGPFVGGTLPLTIE